MCRTLVSMFKPTIAICTQLQAAGGAAGEKVGKVSGGRTERLDGGRERKRERAHSYCALTLNDINTYTHKHINTRTTTHLAPTTAPLRRPHKNPALPTVDPVPTSLLSLPLPFPKMCVRVLVSVCVWV